MINNDHTKVEINKKFDFCPKDKLYCQTNSIISLKLVISKYQSTSGIFLRTDVLPFNL